MSDLVLQFFEEDDATVYVEVGTAASHANPYLQVPDVHSESEIDLLTGSVRIGRTRCRIIDPQTGATQAERFFTALLGDATGYSKLNGRRALLKHATGEVIIDGVCAGSSLTESFAGFIVDIDDIRARGIDVPAFHRTGTSTVFPRGVLSGYGTLPTGGQLLAVTRPAAATYKVDGSFAEFDLTPGGNGLVPADFALTAAMERASAVTFVEDNGIARRVHRDVEIWWRASSASSWNVLQEVDAAIEGAATSSGYTVRGTKPLFRTEGFQTELKLPRGRRVNAELIDGIWAGRHADGQTRPTHGSTVQVLVRYVGPATEDHPFHYEGDFGVFVRNLLRGDYSDDERGNDRDPRLRYDEALLIDPDGPFGFPVRVRQMEPVEDIREYLEELFAQVAGAAALDELGQIAPVLSDLPDESVTLAEINDDNAQAIAAWEHPIDGAITQVEVRYARDVSVPAVEDPLGEVSAGDGIRSDEQLVTVRPQDSDPASTIQDVMGVKVHEIDGFLFRAIAGERGTPSIADLRNEAGYQLAREVGVALIDRFAFGGQVDRVKVMRSDADMAAVKVGDWLVDGRSWSPNYATGERGRNHLVQVVSIRDLNPAWREMRIVDAAPAANPIGQPTLGDITADADGVVTVEVDAIPTGGEARLDYAVSATEPLSSSGLWTFLGRTAVVGTLATPPLPAGSVVWIRSRGEQVGRRPSAWTDAETITLDAPPRLLSANLSIDDAGEPTVTWLPNAYALGVRIYYEVHTTATVPTSFTTYIDADADDLSAVLTGVVVAAGEWITVQVVPYTGFSTGAVSGTAGDPIQITQYEAVEGTPGPEGPEGPQGPPGEPGDESANVLDVLLSGPSGGNYQLVPTLGADVDYAVAFWQAFTDPVPSNYIDTLLASVPKEVNLQTGDAFLVPAPAHGSGQIVIVLVVPYIGDTASGKGHETRITSIRDFDALEQAAADAVTAAAGAQATADGKVTTFFQNDGPTAEGEGDLWIDTNDSNKLYRWSGSAWVEVRDAGIAAAITAAADAQETADGKIVTFYQAGPPTAEGVGDIWIETDDNNEPHRWDGSNWISIRDGRIAEVEAYAETLVSSLGAIIRATTAPTTRVGGSALVVGDMWIDTDNGDNVSSWTGSAWAPAITTIDGGRITTGEIQTGVLFSGEVTGITGDFQQLTVQGWLRSDNFVDGVSGYELTDAGGQINADVAVRATLTIDTGGLGNSIELEFGGTPVGSISTVLSGVAIEVSGASIIDMTTQLVMNAVDDVQINAGGDLILSAFENLILQSLPTSATGLPSGAVWIDAGAGRVLKVIA